MAIWRYLEAAPDFSDELAPIIAAADVAQSTANRTAAELQAMLAAQRAEESGGKAIAVSFGDVGPLPNTLLQDAQNGLSVKASGAQIDYPYDTGATRTFSAWTADELDTDTQSVVATISGSFNSDHPNSLLLSVDAAGTAGFYADFWPGSIRIGWFSGPFGTSKTQWVNTSFSSPRSPTIEFRRDGPESFKALVNGVVRATYNGPLAATPATFTGPGFRHTGFGIRGGWGLLFYNLGAPLSSLSASDIAIPSVRGAGWSFTRTVLTESATLPSGWQPVPAGTFDASPVVRSVVPVGAPGCGGVQIQKSDWYSMVVALRMSASGSFFAGLYTAPNLATPPVLLRAGPQGSAASANGAFMEYFTAGTIVYPAVFSGSGNRIGVGAAAGTSIYFTGHATNQL